MPSAGTPATPLFATKPRAEAPVRLQQPIGKQHPDSSNDLIEEEEEEEEEDEYDEYSTVPPMSTGKTTDVLRILKHYLPGLHERVADQYIKLLSENETILAENAQLRARYTHGNGGTDTYLRQVAQSHRDTPAATLKPSHVVSTLLVATPNGCQDRFPDLPEPASEEVAEDIFLVPEPSKEPLMISVQSSIEGKTTPPTRLTSSQSRNTPTGGSRRLREHSPRSDCSQLTRVASKNAGRRVSLPAARAESSHMSSQYNETCSKERQKVDGTSVRQNFAKELYQAQAAAQKLHAPWKTAPARFETKFWRRCDTPRHLSMRRSEGEMVCSSEEDDGSPAVNWQERLSEGTSRVKDVHDTLNRPPTTFVESPWFDTICAIAILSNSCLIGCSTEYLTTNDEEAEWMIVAGRLCTTFFIVELVLRLYALRWRFFTGEERHWNGFDLILVLFSLVDTAMEILATGGGSSLGSVMKTVKMLRIIRLFRVFRFFQELTVLALMITESMRSLMWALVMMTLIMYVFSICFVTGATNYLSDEQSNSTNKPIIRQRFGSLSRAFNSLLLSMLGGVSWGEISGPLEDLGWVLVGLFFFYIFFTMFAVLNIITGVFVDNAVQTANNQREFLIEKERSLKEKYLIEMRRMFEHIDDDQTGTITLRELKNYLADGNVNSYFQVLGMDPDDSERLFRLLDVDDSGEVNAVEFLEGCLRLKGDAKSIDVHTIMYDCKAMLREVRHLTASLEILASVKAGECQMEQ